MSSHLLFIAPLLLGLPAASMAQRTDRLGDALPDGVIARMGTTRLRESDTVTALVFSPDRKLLASAGANASVVRMWDTATGKEVRQLPVEYGTALAFSPDGKL